MITKQLDILGRLKEAWRGYHIVDVISGHRSFAMGLAMISIVLFHVQFKIEWMWPFNLLGYLGVDVFQFVSGFGCVYALKKYDGIRSFYVKRLLKIIPTCLFVGTVVLLIDRAIGWEYIRYASVAERLFSLHRWYIPLILISYALCPLFYKLIVRYGWLSLVFLFIVCTALGCVAPKVGIWKWPWFLFRLLPFIVGMYVGVSNPKLRLWHILMSGFAFVCAVSYLLVFWWVYFRELPTEMFAIPYSLALPAVIAGICCVGRILKNSAVYKVVEILGIYSLEIYLIHEVTLNGLKMIVDSQLIQAALFIPIVTWGVIATKFCVTKLQTVIKRVMEYWGRNVSMRSN